MKRKIHILGSGNAAKRHREAIERLPALYTIVNYDKADIVVCAGKPADNYRNAATALFNMKDTIIEKPFAANLRELEQLGELESMYGWRVYPVLNYRFSNQCVYVADEPAFIWKRDPSYYDGWRGKKETALGGVIMSHGIHFIDIAISRYGSVGTVFCETDISDDYYCSDVETYARVILGFSTGHTIEIALDIVPYAETTAPPNPGWDHFYENLDSAPRLEELYHLQQVIDACYESAAQERWVTIS